MSLSREARIANRALALNLMLEEVGDNPCSITFINTADSRYEPVVNTTWHELIERGLITDERHGHVKLTTYGWKVALADSGEIEKPEFKIKLGKLCQVLKDEVKGRQNQALKATRQIAAETKLPWGFVINALRGNLIEEVLRRKGAEVNDSMHYVTIPVGFGTELL